MKVLSLQGLYVTGSTKILAWQLIICLCNLKKPKKHVLMNFVWHRVNFLSLNEAWHKEIRRGNDEFCGYVVVKSTISHYLLFLVWSWCLLYLLLVKHINVILLSWILSKIFSSNHKLDLNLLVQTQQWKDKNKVWHFVKFNNEDTRTRSLTKFWSFYW